MPVRPFRPTLGKRVTLLLLFVLALPMALKGQDLRPFTMEDALRVRVVGIADATEDARWIAATASTSTSRMNTDHFRFGDPTYIAPSLVEAFVLDAETGERRDLFSEPTQVTGFAWSPSGDRLAFQQMVNDRIRLKIWDRASQRTRTVALNPDRELVWGGSLEWLPDGSGLILTVRAPGWSEKARAAYEAMEVGPIVVQDASDPFLSWDAVRDLGGLAELARLDLGDGGLAVLGEESGYQDVRVDADGSHVTYSTATPLRTSYQRGEGTEYAYFRLALEEGAEAEEVLEMGEDRKRITWAPDDRGFAWSEDGDVFFKTPEADSARNLTKEFREPISETDSTKLRFSFERWRPDGDGLLLQAQNGYYVMTEGEAPELVWPFPGDTREEWEDAPRVNVEAWTDDGRYLYAARSARDRWERGLVRFDLDRRQEEVLVLDSDLYRSWTVAEDGSRVIFRRSDGDRPDEIWTASGTFGRPTALTDMNPWLAEVALAESRLVKYLDVDGDELYGILYVPPGYEEGGEPLPLVAEIYEDFFDNGYSYSAQIIGGQGWMMLKPSVDLETGFPGEAWIKGVTTAINTLMDKGMVDGDRLGVHGTSYGGYATNLLITQTDRFAAAVNISGKVDIISFLGDSEKITTRNYAAAEIGQDRIGATLWEQPQKYWAHSAVLFADRIETPLLLLTGRGDWNVPDTNTREMYYALRRLGKEVVWVNYMRAGHGAGRAGTVEDYRDHWNRMIDWYRTHFEESGEKGGG